MHPTQGKVPFQLQWSALMVLVTTVLVSLMGVGYTRHVQHESDARWCPLLIIADRPRPAPPQTPDEAEARRRLHQLRLDLGCGGP